MSHFIQPKPPLSPLEQTRELLVELRKQWAEADEQAANEALPEADRQKWRDTRRGIDILLDHADAQLFRLEQQEAGTEKNQ